MTIVYQAYGKIEIIEQVLFSLTSLLFHLGNNTQIRILIYSDQAELIEEFIKNETRVEVIKISNLQIQKWRGTIDFVHRVKIEILKDAGRKFPGNLLYLDGDTYFKASPHMLFSVIDDNNSLMHVAESSLKAGKDPISKKMRKFVEKNKFDQVVIPVSTIMWNAGVIGVSDKNKNLFDQILSLTDTMHSLYPKHVTEQLAVSYWLQIRTTVHPADHIIMHYWNQKEEYQLLIKKFLIENKNTNTSVKKYELIEFPGPVKPKKRFWNFFNY